VAAGVSDPDGARMLMNCAAMALAFVTLPSNWPKFSAWMCGDDAPPVTDDTMRQVFLACRDKMNSAAGNPHAPTSASSR